MPICKIDPWFLAQIEEILAMEARIREQRPAEATPRTSG
jgi:hypothetical protein